MEKSNLDVAFEIMQGRAEAITFSELWEQICVVQGYSETEKNNRIGKWHSSYLRYNASSSYRIFWCLGKSWFCE